MKEEEIQLAAKIAQARRRQEVLARSVLAEREAENAKKEKALAQQKFENELIAAQQESEEETIERRKAEVAEGNRKQQELQESEYRLQEQSDYNQELIEQQIVDAENAENEYQQSDDQDFEEDGGSEEEYEQSEGGSSDRAGRQRRPKEKKPPIPPPPFPSFMFGVACIKELLDIVFSLTAILAFFTPFYSIPYSIMLFFWIRKGELLYSTRGAVIGKTRARLILIAILEAVPFVNMIPMTAWFILTTHYDWVLRYKRKMQLRRKR
ncbi:MAG: hypothetical protein RI996_171 [Candidatus Parcubacteria bacterium]|jgi:hypothetical protein